MTQRGFLIPGMAVAIAILVVALGIAYKWGISQSEKRAEAEAQARQWQATAMECSDSVERAAKASLEASRRAQEALKKARAGNVASQTELARLRGEMGKKATCGQAVEQVRKGLAK